VASVNIAAGDQVAASSSTETIVIEGAGNDEVTTSLTATQAPEVAVGDKATAAVDGSNRSIAGTVVQVGPVQTSSSSDTYPVVVALPAGQSLLDGASAELQIVTGQAAGVTALPTSAVHTTGTTSYVTEDSAKGLTEVRVKVGLVGDRYTQITSGIRPGAQVVLADSSIPVPTSNTTTFGGFSRFGGAGGLGGGVVSVSPIGSGGGGGRFRSFAGG
jgi:hypothetical protein